ncbi:hypothetical protein B296_00043803 [Ensete ventricosum]|uniref:Uncharacterized protein n=1 Tax=Ensete ventricosum TaxID=4639 RepID=A0A426XUS3_ENSVE|nr:hypothetical protein B296_00043803 [Ensete ventricosum]
MDTSDSAQTVVSGRGIAPARRSMSMGRRGVHQSASADRSLVRSSPEEHVSVWFCTSARTTLVTNEEPSELADSEWTLNPVHKEVPETKEERGIVPLRGSPFTQEIQEKTHPRKLQASHAGSLRWEHGPDGAHHRFSGTDGVV